jgi:hypothetical protein
LALAAFAIPIIAKGPELIVVAFPVTAGDIIEKQPPGRLFELEPKQAVLDLGLMDRQPIEIPIEVLFIKPLQPYHVTGGMGGGQPHGRKP